MVCGSSYKPFSSVFLEKRVKRCIGLSSSEEKKNGKRDA